MKRYKVQQYNHSLGWIDVPFAESRMSTYCHGWVDCMDSQYPSPPHRIMKQDDEQSPWTVLRETTGRGRVHTN